MKKNLIYLFSFLCTLSFFAACSDDDDKNGPDEPTPTTWKDYAGEYGTKNKLILNGADLSSGSSTSITVSSGSDDKAKLVLTNIFPEKATIELDGLEMTEKDGVYSFNGETTVGEGVISITGTLTPGVLSKATGATPAALSVNVSRKITSDIVGTWKMVYTDGVPAFKVNMETEDGITGMTLGMIISGQVAPMIGEKVESVTVNFRENGVFDFSWRSVGDSRDTGLFDVLGNLMQGLDEQAWAQLIDIQYYTEGDVVNIAFSKVIFSFLPSMLERLNPDLDIDFDSILKLLQDNGAYYVLPIHMSDGENGRSFYVTKSLIIPVMNVALGMIDLDSILANLPPEYAAEIGELIQNVIKEMQTAKELDVALTFAK